VRPTSRRPGLEVARSAALGLLLFLVACGGGAGETAAESNPADWVLHPQKVHYGGSYSDWSVLWWQWAMELPVATTR
jgi:hypothetical protein